MNILIVSGFLGAGKTTFIKELARRTDKEFVILENEFSETIIDTDLLKKEIREGLDIYEISRGCICCSSKADFADSVLTIANSLDPDAVVTMSDYRKLPKEWWDRLLLMYYDGSIAKPLNSEYSDHLDFFSIQDAAPVSIESFLLFLNGLIRGRYGNIVRSKGSLCIRGTSPQFDVVDGRYSILFTEDTKDNKLVFFGNRIKKQKIREKMFHSSNRIRIRTKSDSGQIRT